LAGFFSLLLVDTFYSRIRTTQAVNRTFTIGRFSDYAILLGVSEMLSIFESDSLVVIFACIKAIIDESPILVIELFENPAMVFALICFYVAASCKCAQFMLFV
jgi:NADH:ubiquinone oxidoreductase subunit 5 (subunit L)/multisubunit Na+/H+ antiporter MnhA subunit